MTPSSEKSPGKPAQAYAPPASAKRAAVRRAGASVDAGRSTMHLWSHPKPPPTHGDADASSPSATGPCRSRAGRSTARKGRRTRAVPGQVVRVGRAVRGFRPHAWSSARLLTARHAVSGEKPRRTRKAATARRRSPTSVTARDPSASTASLASSRRRTPRPPPPQRLPRPGTSGASPHPPCGDRTGGPGSRARVVTRAPCRSDSRGAPLRRPRSSRRRTDAPHGELAFALPDRLRPRGK